MICLSDCMICVHFNGLVPREHFYIAPRGMCDAYPNEIPLDIFDVEKADGFRCSEHFSFKEKRSKYAKKAD